MVTDFNESFTIYQLYNLLNIRLLCLIVLVLINIRVLEIDK